LNKPGKVLLEGRVRFDLTRDDVGRLDVIVNGSPVESYTRGSRPGEITFQLPYEFTSTSWVALRALGGKMDEALGRFAPFFVDPTSQAHTAPIYVTIQGAPPLSAQPAAKVLARKWLAKLDYMQARLAEDQLPNLAAPPGASDGVDLETLRKNREALLQAIQAAKQYFTEMAR
jgi:hypothetical protein